MNTGLNYHDGGTGKRGCIMQDEEWLEQIAISLTEEEIEALGWQPERTWWAMGCFVILVGLSGIISLWRRRRHE
ncbi:hypothetical protein ABMY33_01260 [Vibrio vulnificus]|uniref:hypothetical protein n=1 Tax=Vibrio vulnificus TaxID=672 RepID=UPI004059ED76